MTPRTVFSIKFSDGSLGAPTTREQADAALGRVDPDRRPLCSVVALTEGTREQIVAEWLQERLASALDEARWIALRAELLRLKFGEPERATDAPKLQAHNAPTCWSVGCGFAATHRVHVDGVTALYCQEHARDLTQQDRLAELQRLSPTNPRGAEREEG